MLGLFAAVVALPICFYGCESESARWGFARARLLQQSGDSKQAIEIGKRAIEKSPKDLRLKLELANWMMNHGQAADALPLIDEAVEKSIPPTYALIVRTGCLVHLGRTKEALISYKEIGSQLSQAESKLPWRLNGLAYFRALAGVELDRAMRDIQTAIRDMIADPAITNMIGDFRIGGGRIPFEDLVNASTAMASRHVDKQETVLPVISRRIEVTRLLQDEIQKDCSEAVYSSIQNEFPLDGKEEKEIKKRAFELSVIRRSLSVLLTVRAILYQDIGEKEKCLVDRAMIRSYGYDAEKLLAGLPKDWQCLRIAEKGAQVIDTRGMVFAAGKSYRAAEFDFELAITAAHIVNSAHDSELFNSVMTNLQHELDRKSTSRSEAVLLNHRAGVFEQMGQKDKAENDRSRIRELGFEPGPHLF